MDSEVRRVRGYRHGKHIYVTGCPFCGEGKRRGIHRHGAGSSGEGGLRLSHCYEKRRDYFIEVQPGEAPDDIVEEWRKDRRAAYEIYSRQFR